MTRRQTQTWCYGGAIAVTPPGGGRDVYHLPDASEAPLCGALPVEGERRRPIMLHAPQRRLCQRCVQRWHRAQGRDPRGAWKE